MLSIEKLLLIKSLLAHHHSSKAFHIRGDEKKVEKSPEEPFFGLPGFFSSLFSHGGELFSSSFRIFRTRRAEVPGFFLREFVR